MRVAASVYMHHTTKEDVGVPGTGGTIVEQLCGCEEPNPGPLQEHRVLLPLSHLSNPPNPTACNRVY